MTPNLTDLDMAAGSLHILSHSVEFNETPKSCSHCNWVWALGFEEEHINNLHRPETVPLCDAKPLHLLSISTLYSKYSLGNFDSIDANCAYFKKALAFKLYLFLSSSKDKI